MGSLGGHVGCGCVEPVGGLGGGGGFDRSGNTYMWH